MLNNKTDKTELSYFIDALFCLLALVTMSVFYYGYRVLIITILSIVVCYATDLLCSYLRNHKYIFNDYTSITGGIILTLLMPASVPYQVVVIAAVIATVIGKQAFGGNNNLIFNPVAIGYAIVTLCWSNTMLMFPSPVPMGQLSLASQLAETQSHSLTYFLNMGNIPFLYNFDVLLGRFEGPMGTTHIVILFVCLFCLVIRKSTSIYTVVSALLSFIVGAGLFPLVSNISFKTSVILELISCSAIFALIFLLCDYRIMPKTRTGKCLYGIIFAVITMFLRRYVQLETAAIFAVIISNVLVSTVDDVGILIKKLLLAIKKYSPYILKGLVALVKLIGRLIKKLISKNPDNPKNKNIPEAIESKEQDVEVVAEIKAEEPVEKSSSDVLAIENAKPKKHASKSKQKQTIILEITDKTKHNNSEKDSNVEVKKIKVEKDLDETTEVVKEEPVKPAPKNKQSNKKKSAVTNVVNEAKTVEERSDTVTEKVVSEEKTATPQPKKRQYNKKTTQNTKTEVIKSSETVEPEVKETPSVTNEKPVATQPKKRTYNRKTPQKKKTNENVDGQTSLPEVSDVKSEVTIPEKAGTPVEKKVEVTEEVKPQPKKRTYNRKKPQNTETSSNNSEEKADSKNNTSSKRKTSSKTNSKVDTGTEKGEK